MASVGMSWAVSAGLIASRSPTGAVRRHARSGILRGPLPLRRTVRAEASAGARGAPDFEAVGRYGAATAAETGILTALMWAVDSSGLLGAAARLHSTFPQVLIFVAFVALSLRSRVFNPLPAPRPKVSDEVRAKQERRRPSWTPPGIVFPIVWSTMALLRAGSIAMVFAAGGGVLLQPAVIALCLHLAVGDTWNHVNNVQDDLGSAVPGVLLVWLTALHAIWRMGHVDMQAAYVLAPLGIWLAIASCLVYAIWELNGKPEFYPVKS